MDVPEIGRPTSSSHSRTPPFWSARARRATLFQRRPKSTTRKTSRTRPRRSSSSSSRGWQPRS